MHLLYGLANNNKIAIDDTKLAFYLFVWGNRTTSTTVKKNKYFLISQNK